MDASNSQGAMAGVRALLSLSRVVQASLSVAQPFLAAMVALHGFPPAIRLLLGLSAAFAGFFAVFALNDLLDVDLDRQRFAHLRDFEGFDIDSALGRHPLAQNRLSMSVAVAWISLLAAYALVVAFLLNPVAALLFVAAALLHTLYCKLARVTPIRFLINGTMIGVGTLAGWVAMTEEVRLPEMALLFLWMFAWEIGGRNIVNDFADVDEDRALGIRTVPVCHGPRVSARLTFAFLVVAYGLGLLLQPVSGLGAAYLGAMAVVGVFLLVLPGIRLLASPVPPRALALFNRASFYPVVALVILIVSLYLPAGW